MADEWGSGRIDVIRDDGVKASEFHEVKLFGKWSLEEIQMNDISLVVCFFFTIIY